MPLMTPQEHRKMAKVTRRRSKQANSAQDKMMHANMSHNHLALARMFEDKAKVSQEHVKATPPLPEGFCLSPSGEVNKNKAMMAS